jgi:LacI family transcriptional regulator
MAEWLKTLPKPLGLMTCTDERSQHVIEACKTAEFRVPEDIAIIGVDNDELVCDLSDPPLSSVFQNSEKAGYEAAELLDELMAGKKPAKKEVIVDAPYIVNRQSTDILAIEDREVVEAIRYIREHSKDNIGVGQVIKATALSRRALERRFNKILGRSIYNEIRRTRVEQAVRMLLETKMSISQIASALGYPSVDHIARYFKREKGMSLVAYRKKFGAG